MLDHYNEWYDGRDVNPPILFLVGEQRRDIILKTLMEPTLPQERRIQVDELVIYGTGVMKSFEHDFTNLLQKTESRAMRWVVVFSPTGCEAMLRALEILDRATGKASVHWSEGQSRTCIATIGPTTRDFLRTTFGFEPDICATKPSPEGLEDGIRSFMKDSAS